MQLTRYNLRLASKEKQTRISQFLGFQLKYSSKIKFLKKIPIKLSKSKYSINAV